MYCDRKDTSPIPTISLSEDVAGLSASDEKFLLSSDRSLSITVPRNSCVYIYYAMGLVDGDGGLLIFSDVKMRYPSLKDLRSFPRNVLSFEVPAKESQEVVDGDPNVGSEVPEIYLESNIRNPPLPFECTSRKLNLCLQLNLVDMITVLVDDLRKVDRPLRTDTLKDNLVWINDGKNGFF